MSGIGVEPGLRALAGEGVRWTSALSAGVAALGLLQITVLGRALSAGDFGVLALAGVVVSLVDSTLDLGTSEAVIHRRDVTDDVRSSLALMGLAAGALGVAAANASAPFMSGYFGEPRLGRVLSAWSLVWLMTPLRLQYGLLLQARLDFKRTALLSLLSNAGGTAMTVWAVLAGFGVMSPVYGALATAALQCVLLMLFSGTGWRPRLRLGLAEVSAYLDFGMYRIGDRAMAYAAANADKIVIERALGMEALGFYSVAYQLVMRPIALFNSVITSVAFPVFAILQNETARLRAWYLKALEAVALVNAPVYVGLFAAAPQAVELLIGSGWGPSADVLRVLVWFGLASSLNHLSGCLMVAVGRARTSFWLNSVYLAVLLVLILAGTRWGVLGVAWGIVAAEGVIATGLTAWVTLRIAEFGLKETLMASAPYLIMSVFMGAGVMAVDAAAGLVGPAERLALMACSGAVVYAALVLAFRGRAVREMLGVLMGRRAGA